jgi:hypothetical protein
MELRIEVCGSPARPMWRKSDDGKRGSDFRPACWASYQAKARFSWPDAADSHMIRGEMAEFDMAGSLLGLGKRMVKARRLHYVNKCGTN